MRDSFILYTENREQIKFLNTEQKAALFDAIFDYNETGETSELDPMTSVVFSVIKQRMDRDREKWEETVAKRREAGRAGGLKSAEVKKANATFAEANEANATFATEIEANQAEYVPEYVPDNVSQDVRESKTRARKTSPKHKYGEYQHVLLTDDQYSRLVDEFGEELALGGIKAVDDQIQLKGTKYKDHNLAIRKWGIDAAMEEKAKRTGAPPGRQKTEYHNRYNDFPQRDNNYEKIQEEWIRKSFGAPLPVAGRS